MGRHRSSSRHRSRSRPRETTYIHHPPRAYHRTPSRHRSNSRHSRSRSRSRHRTYIVTTKVNPPHRRPIYLWCGIFTSILLIILIVGLVIGLTLRRRGPDDDDFEPLPPGKSYFNGTALRGVVGGGRKQECGWRTQDHDYAVAVGWEVFDKATEEAGGVVQLNRLCGMRVRAVRERGGRDVSVDVMIAGRCADCDLTDLAMTRVAFRELAGETVDRADIRWAWL